MTKEELISAGWKETERIEDYGVDLFGDKFGCCISIFELEDAAILQDFIFKEEERVKTLSFKELLEEILTAISDFDECDDKDKQSLKIEILNNESCKRR
jgi:hypothetical protein